MSTQTFDGYRGEYPPITAEAVTATLNMAMAATRWPMLADGILSEDGTAILLDLADAHAPNGTRSFVISVRDVT